MTNLAHSFATNKSEQIVRLLLDRIMSSGLRPGDSLGTETDLLKTFGVSRPTLREGLRILESQGVLKLRPGPRGGILMTRPDYEVMAYMLSVLLHIDGVPFSEVLSARIAIEPTLAVYAAQRGTKAQFSEMETSIDRLEAAGNDPLTVYQENRIFHNLIAQAASNPVLEVFWSTIRVLASGEGAGIHYTEKNLEYIVAGHRRILTALRARNPEAAREQVMFHLNELDELVQRRFRDKLERPTEIAFRDAQDYHRTAAARKT